LVTYADTSFVVSLYIEDGNTQSARNYFARNPHPICLTTFSKSEAQHAIRMLAFQRHITLGEMTQTLCQFERDESQVFYERRELDLQDIVLETSGLSHRHALEYGVRYLDMLHLASGLLLKAERFLTFDKRQAKLAEALGLDVKP
jgi:predicted nucleic acid-binding protein